MRAFLIAAAIFTLVQQPTFRTGVDLIRLDVRVVDSGGRPVRDLRPEDFVVTLDGSPRKVAFARFLGPEDAAPQPDADVPVVAGTNTTSPTGRVVVIAVDLESIDPGAEKHIFETAAAFVDRLSPADAVGLLAIPGKGVELTRNHQKVRDALKQLRGSAPAPLTHYALSASDAEAILRDDFTAREVIDVKNKDCFPVTAPACVPDPKDAARLSIREIGRRLQMVVGTLTGLFGNLEPITAPKSVVLLSSGLLQRFGDGSDFESLRLRAASAGVSFALVQLEQPANNVTRRSRPVVTRGDLLEGLSGIAGATDGSFYYGIASASGAFDQIRSEILHSYQLGVESSPADADDRRHRLKVDVKRAGLTVRARKELVIPKKARVAVNAVDVLAQPVDLTETPIAAALLTTRGDEKATLKVILLVELLAGSSGAGSASYAFAVQQDGKRVFETAAGFGAGSSRAAIAAQLAPGTYRLRTAVVDGSGRPGSLDIPIVVGLRQAGGLQFSDLIVGDTRTGTFLPTIRASAGTPIETGIELYSADPLQLEGLTVTMEARRPGETEARVQVPAAVATAGSDRRRVAGAQFAAGSLTPGTWIISAVVRRGEAVASQVSRVLSVQ